MDQGSNEGSRARADVEYSSDTLEEDTSELTKDVKLDMFGPEGIAIPC